MAKVFSNGTQHSFPYQDSGNIEGGPDEFNRLSQVISSNIQKITQNTNSVQKMVNQVGTAQDSGSLRSQLHHVQTYTNQLAKDTHRHLRELTSLAESSSHSYQKQNKFLKEKLTNNFTDVLKNFQTVQRLAAQKEKESVMRARAHSGLNSDPFVESKSGTSTALVDFASPTQPQTTLQMEEEVDITLLEEREQAVKKLESDIVDVNQIFKDLASMVHEQGDMIDSIEANVESTSIKVEEGTQHLVKARQHQAKARKKKCCLLVFGLIVISAVVLVIIFTTKKGS